MGRLRVIIGDVAKRRASAVVAVGAAALVAGCSTTDPYDTTCAQLNSSPDKLREASFKMADKDVKAKVRYEDEMLRICADAPDSYKPAQQVKPEE